MESESATRRLAAILVADIAGYSSLMGADEEATVAALKGHQAALLPLITGNGGRVIDLAGDGILAEFPSVLGAVRTAVAIQATMVERNAAVPPDRRMDFRIGINLGDVIYDEARIYGDGINVAARLQAIAEPGGICLSGKVYDEVVDRIDGPFTDLGHRELKNIARPVRVYALGSREPARPATTVAEGALLAVLPFQNMSGDAEQEYFADGVVEEIITALSRFKSFAVIARNSSFVYKGRAVDVRAAARELGVRYVLEGSVRRAGDALRITAQLNDGASGTHLWAKTYDGSIADIFEFQDRITQNVVGIIEPTIRQSEIERSRRERPDSLAAYDLTLRAMPRIYSADPEEHAEAFRLLEQAISLEPDYGLALIHAAFVLSVRGAMGWSRLTADDKAMTRDLARRALVNAGGDPRTYALGAMVMSHAGREHERSLQLIGTALEANPNDPNVLVSASIVLLHCGNVDEALAHALRVIALTPSDPMQHLPLTAIAHIHMIKGNYAEALTWAERSAAHRGDYDSTYWMLIAANVHLGRMQAARTWLEKFHALRPAVTVASIRDGQPAFDPERMRAILEGLRLAGLPEDAPAEPVLPSLAVLPFANLSGDPEQEYFADGVVDDIIAALSKFRSFAVIARHSSFTYKGRAVDAWTVSQALGVRYVLEGSVRRSGSQLRISAQLVDGTTGAQLWAQRFEGVLDDVFAFQDRITESVVGIVEPQVRRAELARALRERPGSVAAYDFYLRALAIFTAMTDASNREGYDLLMRALQLEPANTSYMALAVNLLQHRFGMGWSPIGPDDYAVMLDLVARASANADDDATVLAMCGNAFVQRIRDYDRGVAMIQRAVELNPNNYFVVALAGVAELHCGDLEVSIALFERAARLNPLDASVALSGTGVAHVKLVQGKYDEAIAWARKSLAINPRYDPIYWMLAAASAHLGRLDEARKYRRELQRLAPSSTIASIRAGQPAKIPARIEPILDGLRLAGLPEDAPAEPVLPSLAVLPFENMGGDAEQDYFADGVVEDIITALSRFRSFAVIARNSSFVYKGRAVDVRQVARDLGVRYVLEGSVRRAGNRLRITAQLVDGTTGAHLWAQHFDGAVDDIFDFQDSITGQVSALVEPQVLRAEIERSRSERPGSLAVYDLYLRSLSYFSETSREGYRTAYALIQQALALEPDNPVLMARALRAIDHTASMGWPLLGPNDRQVALDLAARIGNSDEPDVRTTLGMFLIHSLRDYDRGLAIVENAVADNPNNLMTVIAAGIARLHCGDLGESLAHFHRAITLSPRDTAAHFALTGIAHVHMARREYEEALHWAEKSLASNANFNATYWMLIAASAHLNRWADAERYLAAFRGLSPGITVATIRDSQPAKYAERMASILEGLQLAGMPETAAAEPVLPSLAVLPFQNLSGEAEQEYFADGIVEDIITALSRFRSFAVIARNSSFTYKGRAVDVRQVAEELGVRYILEGSVRKVGGKLRITAQLVDGETGTHLWAERFDGELDELFDFQDRITDSVVAVAAPKVGKAEIERSRRERPRSLDAHDLLMRATYSLSVTRNNDNAEAINLLERAVARDPGNAHAIAWLANAYEHRHSMSWPNIGADNATRAAELARRAIELAPDDPNVLARCGMVLVITTHDYDAGLRLVDRALAANPNDIEVINHTGVAHTVAGNYERALEVMQRTIRLSPADTMLAHATVAVALVCLRRFEEALQAATRALAESTTFNPIYWVLISANAQLGRMDEAHRALEALRKLSPNVAISRIGPGQAMNGEAMVEGLRLAGMPEN